MLQAAAQVKKWFMLWEEKKIRQYSNGGVEAKHITAYDMIYYCTKLWLM